MIHIFLNCEVDTYDKHISLLYLIYIFRTYIQHIMSEVLCTAYTYLSTIRNDILTQRPPRPHGQGIPRDRREHGNVRFLQLYTNPSTYCTHRTPIHTERDGQKYLLTLRSLARYAQRLIHRVPSRETQRQGPHRRPVRNQGRGGGGEDQGRDPDCQGGCAAYGPAASGECRCCGEGTDQVCTVLYMRAYAAPRRMALCQWVLYILYILYIYESTDDHAFLLGKKANSTVWSTTSASWPSSSSLHRMDMIRSFRHVNPYIPSYTLHIPNPHSLHFIFRN